MQSLFCKVIKHDIWYLICYIPFFRITSRARNLLKLIPTDSSVQDTLDSLGQKVSGWLVCNETIHHVNYIVWQILDWWNLNESLDFLLPNIPQTVMFICSHPDSPHLNHLPPGWVPGAVHAKSPPQPSHPPPPIPALTKHLCHPRRLSSGHCLMLPHRICQHSGYFIILR